MPQLPVFIPQGTTGVKAPGHTFQQWAEAASDPTTPGTGEWLLYFKSGGLYVKDDAGSVTGPLSTGGSSSLPRDYISGGILSNNGADAAHDIDVTAGVCRDAADATDLTLSAITKRIDASFATGTGNGGLSSSLTLASDTWYHVHAIIVGGSEDVGFDTSITAANLVTDHSATAYRRLGSVLTDGSSNIVGFTAIEQGRCVHYNWDDPPLDVDSSSLGASRTLYTLSVPTGLRVLVGGNGYVFKSSFNPYVILTSPDQDDEGPHPATAPLANAVGDTAAAVMYSWMCPTDTSSRIAARSTNSGTTIRLSPNRWIECR